MPEPLTQQSPSARTRAVGVLRALATDRTAGIVAVTVLVLGGGAAVWHGGTGAVVPDISDVGAWLSNTRQGSVVHANGASGKADARVRLRDAKGHPLEVNQDGETVLVTDTVTGVVNRIDPAQLSVTQSVDYGTVTTNVVTGAGLAYVLDAQHGRVQRINLTDLSTVGDPIQVDTTLGSGGIDRQGTLWVAAPGRGALVPIANGAAGTPVSVGQPGDAVAVTIAEGTPVATNATRGTMTVVSGGGGRITVNLPTPADPAAPRALLAPPNTEGTLVPVVARDTGELVVVDTASGTPSSVTFAGVAGHELGTPAALGDRIYVPDQSTGRVLVYDAATDQLLDQITVSARATKLDLFVKDGMLWINNADGPEAVAVDAAGNVHRIGKYDKKLPGALPTRSPTPPAPPAGDPQPPKLPPPVQVPTTDGQVKQPAPVKAPASPKQPPAPPKPAPATSSAKPPPPPPPPPTQAPGTVRQTSQSGSILVAFTPVSSSSQVINYTLSGAPSGATVRPSSIPASGPTYKFTVTGLKCANKYQFSVTAHYSSGSASTKAGSVARPCVPPSAPRNLRLDTCTEHQIGVDWDAPADDGGADPGTLRYVVSWSGGRHTGLKGTSDTITGLTNFDTYSVTVAAKNNAGSSQPPASKTATLECGPWRGTTWNPLFDLSVRDGPDTGSGRVTVFPAGGGVDVTVRCWVDGGSWSDPSGNGPNGSTWFRITKPVKGYIASGYVKTSPDVWKGPCP
jgi:outer membrane biosynthesis protein TonB